MENDTNNILSKEELLEFANKYPDNIQRILNSYKYRHLYKTTYDYINSNYTGNKFTEKLYKHIYGEKYCKQCNILLTSKHFRSFFDGYNEEFCSKDCAYKHPQRMDNIKETNIKRYGVENPFQNKEVQAIYKKTMMDKYGCEHNWSKESPLRENGFVTNFKLYGDRHWNNPKLSHSNKLKNGSYIKQAKTCKNTCLLKYGKECVFQVPEIQRKIKNTCLERYGTEYPMQSDILFEKYKVAGYKLKDYTLPSGIIIKVQGYEPLALNEIFKLYSENDVVIGRKNIPKINYELDGKSRKYFPDIYIKSINLIVEVKSTYYFKKKKEETLVKHETSKLNGFNHEIWIFNEKEQLIEKII